MIDFIYRCLPVVFGCHCIDERSFHFRGRKFPICSRCTGELVGIVMFGYGIFTLFIISTIAVFMFGVNIAKK